MTLESSPGIKGPDFLEVAAGKKTVVNKHPFISWPGYRRGFGFAWGGECVPTRGRAVSACSHQRQGCSCHKNHTGLKWLLFVSEQTRIVACLGRVLLEAWKEPVKGAIDPYCPTSLGSTIQYEVHFQGLFCLGPGSALS